MNLYISADMEGVAGVCSWDQVDARGYSRDYAIYQRYLTQEVRAAIDGAREGGASGVLINDSHGPMRNLLWDELPDDVRMIYGNRKPLSMMQGLDSGAHAAFFIGYHGGIGVADAVLGHTYTPSVIYDVRVNGIRCSEATLNAGIAGYYGVPVVLVSGDRTTVDATREQMPWIRGVVVKESIGNYAADSLSPQAARSAIQTAAREAMRTVADAKPFIFQPPITLEIDVTRVEQADFIQVIPGFERTGARTVRLVHDDYLTVFKAFVAAFRMGAAANDPD